jgi:hypothetical protein
MEIMRELIIYSKLENINGFTVKDGFASWINENGILCITSGWLSNDCLYVYTKRDGEWIPEWDSDSDIEQVIRAIADYKDAKTLREAVDVSKLAVENGQKLFVSDKPLVFTDTVQGDKCNNGGEYGFRTVYRPTANEGVYEVVTKTTCDFDNCGTGPQGYEVLTEDKYQQLRRESDDIESQGSLY